MAKGDPLLAARVSHETADVLDAAAFVRRLNMQKLLGPAIERFAQELLADPHVQAALAARRDSDHENQAAVTPIQRRPSRP
jgi:hypothetical protein